MVRIWYSVLGDGMGHAMRSAIIIEHLLASKHEVLITAADKAYPYLSKKFLHVHEIKGDSLVYQHNAVKEMRTLGKFLREYNQRITYNVKLIAPLLKEFKPQLVISDFESFADYTASFLQLPRIAIDNVSLLTECVIHTPAKHRMHLWQSQQILNFLHPKADYYLIPSFVSPVVKNKKAFLFMPLVRKELVHLQAKQGAYIFVYQTTDTNKKLIKVLHQLDEQFVVYGFNKADRDKNILFRSFSDTQILTDMKNAKAVIVNGGFTVISEALFFRKPILCIPIKKQPEQLFNGVMIQQSEYGRYAESITVKDVRQFLQNLEQYQKKIDALPSWSNDALLQKLDACLKELCKRPTKRFNNALQVELLSKSLIERLQIVLREIKKRV